MSLRPRDPLLAAVQIMLGIGMGIFALAVAAAIVAVPAALVWRDQLTIEIAGKVAAPPEAIWAVIALLLLAGGVMALGFLFFRNLYRIVATVGEGDPFVPVNARRLQGMGWIAVAAHVLVIPIEGLGNWLEHNARHVQVNFEIPLSGLLLALILFILARVFREGTRMRDELEGTV